MVEKTPEQRDESFKSSYWRECINYGLQYYVAGRFATAHHFSPVAANILHHAVEMLLKACLAVYDDAATIRTYANWNVYRHDLNRLWAGFKRQRGAIRGETQFPEEFGRIIEGLHEFENIRYPEKLVVNGALISIGIFELETPIASNGVVPETAYTMMLPQIDRLVGYLFAASDANPDVFWDRFRNDEVAMKYYALSRRTLLGEAHGADSEDVQ